MAPLVVSSSAEAAENCLMWIEGQEGEYICLDLDLGPVVQVVEAPMRQVVPDDPVLFVGTVKLTLATGHYVTAVSAGPTSACPAFKTATTVSCEVIEESPIDSQRGIHDEPVDLLCIRSGTFEFSIDDRGTPPVVGGPILTATPC